MNILITGASGGIGFETAIELSKDSKNRIIAIARNEEKLRLLKEYSELHNNNIDVFPIDITTINEDSIEKIMKDHKELDILINNAGYLINKGFMELSMDEWKQIFEVNLFSLVNLCRLLFPYMNGSKASHILNIGSMGGVQGTSKFAGLSAYSASKAAVTNFTECLAEELKAYNIYVNCIALGAVNTEMLQNAFPDYKAPINSDEIAKFIAYFSLNGHHFMNGKILPVSSSTP